MSQRQKIKKKKFPSLKLETNQSDTIVNDYKKLVNMIVSPSDWFGYLPLVLFGITTYGTYYFYKKNKLKTAAAFGALPVYFFIQPITRRIMKPYKSKSEN